MPKRVKYRKLHKGRMRGKARSGYFLVNGEYGLQATSSAWITDRQIEAARVTINRHMKRVGKLWIRIFPSKPVTKKPAETRMGGGKGAPDHWVAVVKRGRILFEISGCPEPLAREAFELAGQKLSVHTRYVMRDQMGGN